MENTAVKATAKKAVKAVKATTTKTVKATDKAMKTVSETTKDAVEAVIENAGFATESLNAVKATAEIINSQIKDATTEITKEVKEVAADVKAIATKAIKGKATKADFNKGVKKVKESAKDINAQITQTSSDIAAELKETTTEIVKDVKATATEMSKDFRKTTNKLAKEAIENANVTERLNSLKKVVANANDYALETSETMIDGFVANSEKWQKVAEKAIKSGLKVAEKNQNLMFTTLEAVKTQLVDGNKRFKKLVYSTKKAETAN
jgi:hypothetical protein